MKIAGIMFLTESAMAFYMAIVHIFSPLPLGRLSSFEVMLMFLVIGAFCLGFGLWFLIEGIKD